jgi:predicted DNA-binding transcriptional regulator AlpA
VYVIERGGRLWKVRALSREGIVEWLAVNLPEDEDRLLTRAAVAAKTGLSVARLKELEKEDPTFPKKQVFKGTRRVGFWLSDVRAWMRTNVAPEAKPISRKRTRRLRGPASPA